MPKKIYSFRLEDDDIKWLEAMRDFYNKRPAWLRAMYSPKEKLSLAGLIRALITKAQNK